MFSSPQLRRSAFGIEIMEQPFNSKEITFPSVNHQSPRTHANIEVVTPRRSEIQRPNAKIPIADAVLSRESSKPTFHAQTAGRR
jgi:hypothetical protein